MPTRDRSLLGVGDERGPEAPPSASRYAVRTVAERDDELHDFRRRYPWLRGLAVRLVGDPDADDVVAEAMARCLIRRPLERWDDEDLEHAVLVVADEHPAPAPVRAPTRRPRAGRPAPHDHAPRSSAGRRGHVPDRSRRGGGHR